MKKEVIKEIEIKAKGIYAIKFKNGIKYVDNKSKNNVIKKTVV